MVIIKTTTTTKQKISKDVEKLESLCTAGENTEWYSCYRKQYGGFPQN